MQINILNDFPGPQNMLLNLIKFWVVNWIYVLKKKKKPKPAGNLKLIVTRKLKTACSTN